MEAILIETRLDVDTGYASCDESICNGHKNMIVAVKIKQ